MSLEEKHVKDCEEVSLMECESVDVAYRNYLRQRIKYLGELMEDIVRGMGLEWVNCRWGIRHLAVVLVKW